MRSPEEALRILYQRKAFREETGTDEEHYPKRKPPPRRRHIHRRATAPSQAQAQAPVSATTITY